MLIIENLTHGFQDRTLYKNVNIKINKGNKIGLVGVNGSGKSTLINILTGQIICDSGELKWEGNYRVGYLDQYAKIDENQSIYNYLESAFADIKQKEAEYNKVNERFATATPDEFDSLTAKATALFEYLDEHNFYSIDSDIKKVAGGLGIAKLGFDTPIKNLSGGQRTKVILCKLLLEKPDLLILDEPTNHLDTAHIEWLTEYLKNLNGTFLIVSHDTHFLDNVCNVIWSVEYCNIVRYNGNYSAYVRQRAEKEKTTEKAIRKQELQIAKLKDYIARNSVRTSTARQAQSRQKQLDKMEIIEKPEVPPTPKYRFLYTPLAADVVIKTHALAVGYERPLLENINLIIRNGEKWRISGFNGIGKTTLLKTLLGEIEQKSGKIAKHPFLQIGYFAQDIKWDDPTITPIEELRNEFPRLEDKQLRGSLAKAGLAGKYQIRPLESLSGGEQSKVKLSKFLLQPFNFIILDEPTNHLDVISKKALAKAVNEFAGTVIFVSHEEDFVKLIDCKTYDLSRNLIK